MYSNDEVYFRKCKESNLLPLAQRFELNDVILFHKIVYQFVNIDIPSYITPYTGNSRLRSTHLDCLSYVASLDSLNSSIHSQLYKSFFFRTIHIWNKLPLEVRSCPHPHSFKRLVLKSLWERLNPAQRLRSSINKQNLYRYHISLTYLLILFTFCYSPTHKC